MKPLLATIISLFFASAPVGAFAVLHIDTPSPAPTQCSPVILQWSGGAPPYFLAIVGTGDLAVALQRYDGLFDTSFLWSTNITARTSIALTVTDVTGTLAQSAPFIIHSSSDISCLESSVPNSSDISRVLDSTTFEASTDTFPAGITAGASAGASGGAGATAVATAGVGVGPGGVSVGASAGAGGGTAGATAVATAGVNEGIPTESATGPAPTSTSRGSTPTGSSSTGSTSTEATTLSTTSPTGISFPLVTSTTSDALSSQPRPPLPMGTIMGITAGALIVLLTMVALLVWKRKQAVRSAPHAESAPDAATDLMKSASSTTQLVAQPYRLKPLPAAPEYAANAADPRYQLGAVPQADSQSEASDSNATIHDVLEIGRPATSATLPDVDATDTYPVSSPRPLYGFPSSDPPDRRAPKHGRGDAARARPVPVYQAPRAQETDSGVRLAGGRPVEADAEGASDVHSTVPPPYAPY